MSSSNAAFTRDLKDKAIHHFETAKVRAVETSKEAGKRIDTHAHKRPWYYVSIAAFCAAAFGFLLGRKTKR